MNVATAPPFIDIGPSWPLTGGEFELLTLLTGFLRPAATDFRVRATSFDLVAETALALSTIQIRLRRLENAGYLHCTYTMDGPVIDLEPTARRINPRPPADSSLHYLAVAKTDNRAWLVLNKFPDDPIVALDVQHDLQDGVVIGSLSITAWQRARPNLVGRRLQLETVKSEIERAMQGHTPLPVNDGAE